MLLLRECLTFDQAGMITETAADDKGNKSLYMQGRFIVGGVKNLNQRVYPVSEIKAAVDHINTLISNGESVLGECDHPQELTINLDRVSHVIEKMWMEGNVGMGRLKVIPTPKGEIIRTLVENNIKLGISSRGSGNVDYNGNVEGFEIITCDLVAKPSGQDCFPTPVFEHFGGRRAAVIDDLASSVRYDPAAQKYLTREVMSFIENLK